MPSERLARRIPGWGSRGPETAIDKDHDALMTEQDGPLATELELEAPCRKCDPCLVARASQWARRCASEIRASHRTWFVTFTLSPESHFEFLTKTRVRLHTQEVDLESLTEVEQFTEREHEISREFQLMWKRLRKGGAQFRFILVCESTLSHQGGLPHYHAFIHEVGDPIRHKTLKRVWPHGFAKYKLCDEGGRKLAWYVCKYLTKDASARVRASVWYGVERQPTALSHNHPQNSSDKKNFEFIEDDVNIPYP
jgi:hypothetical protein